MNRRRKPPQHRIKDPTYRPVFERLDAALEQNTQSDNAEKIRLLRRAAFADVDAFVKSGTMVIPK